MNFKRKAGAAVLAIAAASAIAVPGVAMAATTTPVDNVGTFDASTGTLTVTTDEQSAIEDYIQENASSILHVVVNSSEIEKLDISDAVYAASLVVTASDMTDLDGLDTFGTSTITTAMVNAAETAAGAAEAADTTANLTNADTLRATATTARATATAAPTDTALENAAVAAETAADAAEAADATADLTDATVLRAFATAIANVKADGTVSVDITAADLINIDFGDNDAALVVDIDTDLETLDMSGLDNMTSLSVRESTDLESLNVSEDEDLAMLDISNTKIASLDTSDTAITAVGTGTIDVATDGTVTGRTTGLYATGIELDKQNAAETVNDDDDDFNDYTLDLDSITGGYAERVQDADDSGFLVALNNTTTLVAVSGLEDFDYDDGELVATDEKAPATIQYTNMTDEDDNSNVIYTVTFDVKTAGSRIAGTDRYDTMHELNTNEGDNDFDEVFDGATDIVVASGAGYADALSSSALAGALNTGIVTTPVDSMTDDTIDMLDDMGEQGTAYIVGGTSAVSYAVEQQLTDLGFKISRMAGADRFDTAVKTQDKIQDLMDDASVTDSKTVIIASGVNYADALAIAPYAYNKNTPIVLVGADGTMDDDTAALFNKYKKDYKHAVVVGGTAVVSDDVVDTLKGYDMDVIRLAGADRFETNLVINDWLDRANSDISTSDDIFAAAGYSKDDIKDFNDEEMNAGTGNTFDGTAYVVTGMGYADALAVAPLAGMYAGTINMVSDTNMTTVTEAVDNDASTKVVGGTSAISSDVFDAIEAL